MWQPVSAQFAVAANAASGSTSILAFEAPTAGSLTSLPPEDVTILRVVGDFTTALSAALGNWTLGLMVVDATWTPTGVFEADADKRVLWHRTYENLNAGAACSWSPPDRWTDGNITTMATREAVSLDISPKVRLEQGKALKLVWWENGGSATMTVQSSDMRVLYQRSRR